MAQAKRAAKPSKCALGDAGTSELTLDSRQSSSRKQKKASPTTHSNSSRSPSITLVSDSEPARSTLQSSSDSKSTSLSPEPYERHDNDEFDAQNVSEELEDELDEEPPLKRRKGMISSFISSFHIMNCEEDTPPTKITVNLSLYTAQDILKAPKKREAVGSAILKVDNQYSFRKFERTVLGKAARLAKIAVAPDPDDEEVVIQFQVPRVVVNFVSLDDLTAYDHMLESAQKLKDPVINIAIAFEDIPVKKADADDNAAVKKKGKKSKVPSENDISPVNSEINTKIALLRTKHTCHANDGSDHCWVSGEEKEHIPLGNAHFNMWAAAWAHGTCDDETPPNHAIFSNKGNASRLAAPSILQRRIAANANQQTTSAAPVFNIAFPDGMLNLFRPPPAAIPAPNPAAPPAPNAAPDYPVHQQRTLLPLNTQVGNTKSISTFCTVHDLDMSICDKLTAHGYKKTLVFYLIQLADLEAMKFLAGEIAELREAVREWAVPM
ncbi:hypothetical protein B0H12DRAFT_1239962 [Mycena haematopus]|nr:hypothetical protein B0H12DRAFT_1239962 [Mycena haematopus]